jgi:glutamate synthase (NADPH/NADH) small chain
MVVSGHGVTRAVVVDRRVTLLEQEGVVFKTGVEVGVTIPAKQLQQEYDAVLLCGGSTIPRDLSIPGRQLQGIHFAMDFLTQQNRRVAGRTVTHEAIHAGGKNVVVLGGGDTGSDCVGTSNRHGARSVTQIEILNRPPEERTDATPWPNWPLILRTSTSHEEGCDRKWSLVTKEFIGDEQGALKALRVAEVVWKSVPGKAPVLEEIKGTEKVIPCELALLALGFVHPQREGLIEQLGVDLDERGNVHCQHFHTSVEGVFAAGDMRRGQSLVVWAIHEGREAARAVDVWLMGESALEAKETGILSLA